jgi:hypothetical protein
MVKKPSNATVTSGLTKQNNIARAKASICSVEDFALNAISGKTLFSTSAGNICGQIRRREGGGALDLNS